MLDYFRLVGGVQIRQQRMASDSCRERRFTHDYDEKVINGTTVRIPR